VQYVDDEPSAHTSALNAARESAKGDFIVHAHPGVVWDGNKLERQVEFLSDNPSAPACVHSMTVRGSGGRSSRLELTALRSLGPRIACLLSPPWGRGVLMARREFDRSLGVYRNIDETLWEHDVRLAFASPDVGLIDDDLAVWNKGSEPLNDPPLGLVANGPRYEFLQTILTKLEPQSLIRKKPDVPSAALLLAALHTSNDDLDAGLGICQDLAAETDRPELNYWLGVIHRRRPDFDKARWWFRKSAGLDAASGLHARVTALLQQVLQVPDYGEARETALHWLQDLRDAGIWDPCRHTDICESCEVNGREADRRLLEEVQAIEFAALIESIHRLAQGG
jgi:hypothetical protein